MDGPLDKRTNGCTVRQPEGLTDGQAIPYPHISERNGLHLSGVFDAFEKELLTNPTSSRQNELFMSRKARLIRNPFQSRASGENINKTFSLLYCTVNRQFYGTTKLQTALSKIGYQSRRFTYHNIHRL